MPKKFIDDPKSIIPLDVLAFDETLSYEGVRIENFDRKLKRSRINNVVKLLWTITWLRVLHGRPRLI